MSDRSQDRVPRDLSKINVDDEFECHYWSAKLGVTVDQLQEALHQVGTSVDTVVSYLATPATGRTS